tara:strand:- start:725 stop:913 length:189 start_codon:yes stop_codon:yes gene_type:complete
MQELLHDTDLFDSLPDGLAEPGTAVCLNGKLGGSPPNAVSSSNKVFTVASLCSADPLKAGKI